MVWEENGEILGYAHASSPYEKASFFCCAEPSIYMREDARGRSVGGKLYAALEAILMEQSYQVLYALITEENFSSIRFHEKRGYEFLVKFPDCGFKFNRWLGLIWMEKRLKSVEISKKAPTPFSNYCQDVQRIYDILDNLSLS